MKLNGVSFWHQLLSVATNLAPGLFDVATYLSTVVHGNCFWLVVWNIFYLSIYIYIGNFIIPTDELICFRGVGLNHQPGLTVALENSVWKTSPGDRLLIASYGFVARRRSWKM